MDGTLGLLAEIAASTFQGLLDYCAVSTVEQPGSEQKLVVEQEQDGGDPTVIEVLAPANARENQAGSGQSVHSLQRHRSQNAQLKVEPRIKARWRRSTYAAEESSAPTFEVKCRCQMLQVIGTAWANVHPKASSANSNIALMLQLQTALGHGAKLSVEIVPVQCKQINKVSILPLLQSGTR